MTTLKNKLLDLITLGETHLELCGEQIGANLKDMLSFRKYVAGLPATVAIGCARLGLKTALISSISSDQMGKFILETLQQEKVNTRHVNSSGEKSTTLLMRAIYPTESNVFFQSENPTSKTLSPTDIPPEFIASSQALLLTTTNFLQEKISECSSKALSAARENGTKVILFLESIPGNASSQTYDLETLREKLSSIIPACDLIIGSEETYRVISNTHDVSAALKQLRSLGNAILVLKQTKGSYVFPSQIPCPLQETIHYSHPSVKNRCSVDGTDAFIAGFLKGWLQNNSLEKCCQLGMMCLSIAQSHPNNMDYLPSEKELFIATSQSPSLLEQTLQSAHFNHVHYSTTRPHHLEQYFIFQLGSLQQWEKMLHAYEADETFFEKTKALIAKGISIAAQSNLFTAVIIDEEKELDLFNQPYAQYRLIRSVDTPNVVPFQFKNNPDITHTLLKWPTSHRVKATVVYHPDDRYALRCQQEMILNLLHRSCRETKHELFLEIAPAANSLITASTIAHIMQRFYEIGIYPDGWIISVPRDQRSWDSIIKVIDEHDPYCKGVIATVPSANLEQLNMIFGMISKQKYCKGFIAGKNLFHPLLKQWFNQKLTEHAFVDMVATSFHHVMDLWEQSVKTASKEMMAVV